MDNYVVNERGEKVVGGSRRPDGTVRKERRIRAGYTPQDEQPTYVSAGAMSRQGVQRCPGYDAAADVAASAAAKSKAAKKNEKRKAKKEDGGAAAPAPAGAGPSTSSSNGTPAAAAAAVVVGSGGGDDGAAAAGPALSGPAAAVDRQIKALSKKVRQCQALLARETGGGEALNSQEREKVDKMPGWEKEIKELQAMMAKLTA